MVNSCLCQFFDFDCMRLRFLYPSNVEPILTYVCSVGLSKLKTQAGKKPLRSFQRFAARLITRSFKTAPTDSLLVLANLLLLDLHLLLASLRYLSMKLIGGFSPSLFQILYERVSFLIFARKIPPVKLLNIPELPPWAIKVFISSMLGFLSQCRNYSTVFPRSFLCCLALAPSLKCSDVSAIVRTLRSQLPSASLWFLCLLRLAWAHSLESIPHFLLDCPNTYFSLPLLMDSAGPQFYLLFPNVFLSGMPWLVSSRNLSFSS